MKIYLEYANIELTEQEANWLRLPGSVPAAELRINAEHSYRDFQDKLEHAAKEVHQETGLTVLIGWGDSEIAHYNENGLSFLDDYDQPKVVGQPIGNAAGGWQTHPGTHCGHYFPAGESLSLCRRESRASGGVLAECTIKCMICRERTGQPINGNLFAA